MKISNQDVSSLDPKALAQPASGAPRIARAASAARPSGDSVSVDSSRRDKVAALRQRLAETGQSVQDLKTSEVLVASVREALQGADRSPLDVQGLDPKGAALALLA